MSTFKQLKGIILKSYDYGDSSRIVRLFTRDMGLISFMAKGAKRNKSRTLNLTEPFVEGEFNLNEGKTMYYIKDGEIVNSHLGLRKSIQYLTCANYMVEIMEQVLIDDSDENLYDLFSAAINACEKSEKVFLPRIMSAFLMKLVSILGFRPTLGRCVNCGKMLDSFRFDLEQGGMICEAHISDINSIDLAKEEYNELVYYIRKPLIELIDDEENVQEKVNFTKIHSIIYKYFKLHVENCYINSEAMMQQLNIL